MFYPSSGPWSIQDFSDRENLTLGQYQTITGGYLTMQPLSQTSTYFTRRWDSPSSWQTDNNLNSITIIDNSFIRTGTVAISGQTVGITGYSQHLAQAGAWNVRTEYPIKVGDIYSGQEQRGLLLSKISPDSGWYRFFSGGGSDATLEFDIASTWDIYSGTSVLGFSTGQEALTALPRKSGILNHGIYIDNGSNWDFIELNPFGLRSSNHPELAIPIDLTQIKRVRIGIAGNNIYLSTEDGRGVAGLSKFDTAVISGNDAKIFFGAPPVSGYNWKYPLLTNGLSGFVGETFWDNIRLSYGQNVVTERTGSPVYFSTTNQTAYTDAFDPQLRVVRWNSATVGHTHHKGGVTIVTAQYSGMTGWSNHSSITLTGQQSPTKIDLTSMPAFSTSRTGTNHNQLSNPIRFSIQQKSFGLTKPASIDYISMTASTEEALLDLLPNWKTNNQSLSIQIAVDSGNFYASRPAPDQFTTFLLTVPKELGVLTGGASFDEASNYSRSVFIDTVAENIYGGPSSNSIKNYVEITGIAKSGSMASSYFGQTPVRNFYPNPLLEDGFYNVSGSSYYVHNRAFGDLAIGLDMIPSYTGRSSIIYQPQDIFRPEAQATIQRINAYLGRTQSATQQYVQTITVPNDSFAGTHDLSCGLEAIIPSGIASGNMLMSVDIQIPYGTGIQIYATGSVSGSPSWRLPGNQYRQYRNVSFPIVGTTGEIRIGFAVPSGTLSSEFISYNIDNLTLSPVTQGFLYSTGVTTFVHSGGLYHDNISGVGTNNTNSSCTVLSMDSKILAYPTGSNNIIFSKYRDSDGKGFKVYVTNSGYLAAQMDMESRSWSTGVNSQVLMADSFPSTGLVTDYVVPLGRWVNIGLAHQASAYSKLGYANFTGSNQPVNFASSNRIYLTVDGSPVGVLDAMRTWPTSHSGQLAPYISYIADQTGTLTIASGIYLEVDNVKISKPISADAEIDLSIKSARITLPYLVPNEYCKPTATSLVPNSLITLTGSTLGDDLYLGSIYNFDGPGYTNWDHGPWANHLLFYGAVSKGNSTPYTGAGLGSTYIPSGSYAIAKYSSSTERLINTTGNLTGKLDLSNTLSIESGRFKFGGWVCPYTSGQDFFHIFMDSQNLTGNSLSLGFDPVMKPLLTRRAADRSLVWQRTGSNAQRTGAWNWIEVNTILGNYSGVSSAGEVKYQVRTLSGEELNLGFSGSNYGFQYMGRSGTPTESCIVFGKTAEVSLVDWFICPVRSGDTAYIQRPLEDKSGRYQVLLENNELSDYPLTWNSFQTATTIIGPTDAQNISLSLGMHNYYDAPSRMNFGSHIFDDQLFKIVPSYYMNYSTDSIHSKIGNNNSPIRIGNQVPDGAVNLGRVSSLPFTPSSSISVIDLSFKNLNNLTSYKDGVYTISKANGNTGLYTTTGSFKGINSGLFSGLINVMMSGQVHSSDIDLSSIGLSNPYQSRPASAFFCYLLGRGRYGVKISDYYPHPTGEVKSYATGSYVDNYVTNTEKVLASISLKDSDGNVIPYDSFPYSIVTSPYQPQILHDNIKAGNSFNINGLGSFISGSSVLPDGVFSVFLLTNSRTISDETSVWAYYPSIDLTSNEVNTSFREIVNPVPLMRRAIAGELELPGQYKFSTDNNTLLYSVTIHGINSGYSNKF